MESLLFYPKYIAYRKRAIDLLKTGAICISYNDENKRKIWGYYLYDKQTKLFVWDEFDKTIFDDLLENADDSIFRIENKFIKIRFPEDIDLSVFESSFFRVINRKLLTKIYYDNFKKKN